MFIDVVFLAEKLWDLFRVIAHEAWALLFPKSCDCFQYAGNTKKGAYSVKLCRNVALTFYRRKFVSSKLYACLEKFLCFLQLSDRAYVSGARCIVSLLSLVFLAPQDWNVATVAYKSVFCFACCRSIVNGLCEHLRACEKYVFFASTSSDQFSHARSASTS